MPGPSRSTPRCRPIEVNIIVKQRCSALWRCFTCSKQVSAQLQLSHSSDTFQSQFSRSSVATRPKQNGFRCHAEQAGTPAECQGALRRCLGHRHSHNRIYNRSHNRSHHGSRRPCLWSNSRSPGEFDVCVMLFSSRSLSAYSPAR